MSVDPRKNAVGGITLSGEDPSAGDILGGVLPFVSGLLPGAIDLITGASSAREDALNQQDAALAKMIGDTDKQIGKDVSSSMRFRTLMAALERAYGKQRSASSADAVASGASEEAQLGTMAKMNEAFNASTLNAVGQAEQERDRLRQHRDQLLMQRYSLGVNRTTGDLATQNQFTSGLAAVLPYIVSGSLAPKKPQPGGGLGEGTKVEGITTS